MTHMRYPCPFSSSSSRYVVLSIVLPVVVLRRKINPSDSRFSSAFSLRSKTRAVSAGRSLAVCPGNRSDVISGQLGLHVNVIKNNGEPIFQHNASPLYVLSLMSPGEPMYDEGRAVFFLSVVALPPSVAAFSCPSPPPRQSSAWFSLAHSKFESSIRQYWSQRYWPATAPRHKTRRHWFQGRAGRPSRRRAANQCASPTHWGAGYG